MMFCTQVSHVDDWAIRGVDACFARMVRDSSANVASDRTAQAEITRGRSLLSGARSRRVKPRRCSARAWAEFATAFVVKGYAGVYSGERVRQSPL